VRGKPILGVAVVMAGVAIIGMITRPRVIPAAERISSKENAKAQKDAIAVDVVIEDVDISANTITARATDYVVPPHGNVGGAVFRMGTTDSPHKERATRFVRLPVMPEAKLQNQKVKRGLHAILRLEVMRRGPLVVVGIEQHDGPEKVGVESLDAVGTEDGK
jgi:hypothetical protein